MDSFNREGPYLERPQGKRRKKKLIRRNVAKERLAFPRKQLDLLFGENTNNM